MLMQAVVALARTMEKIHRNREIGIEVSAPQSAKFRGERRYRQVIELYSKHFDLDCLSRTFVDCPPNPSRDSLAIVKAA